MSSEIDYSNLYFREKEEKERLADLVLRQSNNISNLIDLLRSSGERHDNLFIQYNDLRTKFNELVDEINGENEDDSDNVSIISEQIVEVIVDDEEDENLNPLNITLQNITISPIQIHLIKRHFNEETICPICLDSIDKDNLAIPDCRCNTPFHATCFSQFLTHGIRQINEYRTMMAREYDGEDPKIACPCCRYDFYL